MQKFYRNKKMVALTLMMMPGFIWLLLIRYLPMGGLVMAFQRYRPYAPNPTLFQSIIHSKFNDFANFGFLFATSDSANMVRNTLLYNAAFIILTLVIAVAFAIMISEVSKKFARAYQTLMFFPYFLSWIVVSYFVYAFFAPNYGLMADGIDWYNDTTWWPLVLIVVMLWKSIGYSCILYLAAITGIDQQQYEAAAIDGATKWQQIWKVTIPNIRSMIIILFIMNVGRIFNADFGLFYTVPKNSGALYPVTQVIDTYVYIAMTTLKNNGMSTAAGLFQNVIGFICIMLTNTIIRKVDADSALF